MGVPETPNETPPEPAHAAAKELLLADLQRFEESMWRSEDIGEKRFNFFVTLITSVAGGLGAISALGTGSNLPLSLGQLTCFASIALLLFGLLSFFRMRHRDSVTKGYKGTTKYVRDFYLALFAQETPQLVTYKLPLKQPDGSGAFEKLKRGGYTVSVAMMNGALLMVAVLALEVQCAIAWIQPAIAAACGVALAAVLCAIPEKPPAGSSN
jgi:hypothetical protein